MNPFCRTNKLNVFLVLEGITYPVFLFHSDNSTMYNYRRDVQVAITRVTVYADHFMWPQRPKITAGTVRLSCIQQTLRVSETIADWTTRARTATSIPQNLAI